VKNNWTFRHGAPFARVDRGRETPGLRGNKMCSPETANGEYSRAKQALYMAMLLPENQEEAIAVLELAKELVAVVYKPTAPAKLAA
jgi:hypothetical protein